MSDHSRAGYFVAFLFLLCGAMRLARFNVQKNPIPKNPGRPDRKYFVGCRFRRRRVRSPAVVYASDRYPLHWWLFPGLGCTAGAVVLPDGQHLALPQFQGPESVAAAFPADVFLLGECDLICFWNLFAARPAGLAIAYVGSGIAIRVGGLAAAAATVTSRNRSIKLAKSHEHPMVAVVGGDTLLAPGSVRTSRRVAPAPRLQLVSAAAEDRQLSGPRMKKAAVLMMPLAAESLEGARVSFWPVRRRPAGDAIEAESAGRSRMIDLTAALEEQPNARLRAPSAEPAGPAERSSGRTIHVIAHPAAIALATLFARLHQRAPIRRRGVHVFEPASERGQRGLDELQQQTVGVLSFQEMEDRRVRRATRIQSAGALWRGGAGNPWMLIEQRLERHLASSALSLSQDSRCHPCG